MLYIVKVCYMKRERISQVFSLYAYGYEAESRGLFAHNKLNTYLYKCI